MGTHPVLLESDVDAVDGDEGENADRTRDVSISAVEWVFQRGVVFRWPGGKGGREKDKEVEATNEKTLCDDSVRVCDSARQCENWGTARCHLEERVNEGPADTHCTR